MVLQPVTKVEFITPLPPRGLSPNGAHGHYAAVAAAKRLYRHEVFVDARNACLANHWRAPQKAKVSIRFCTGGRRKDAPGRYRPLDVANAVMAFKAGFDALKDGGLILDDSHRHLLLGSMEIDSDTGPWVVLTLEEVK